MVATEGLREMEGSALRRLVCRDEAGAGGPGSPSRCLVLDCRPFLAHSAGHIRGALNVRCNTIVRRRAKGAVSLEQILPAEGEVRARLRAGLYAAVVVYDERSPRAEALREDSTVALVVRALRRDTARADIRLLAGTGGGVAGWGVGGCDGGDGWLVGAGRGQPPSRPRGWGSGLAAPPSRAPAVLPGVGSRRGAGEVCVWGGVGCVWGAHPARLWCPRGGGGERDGGDNDDDTVRPARGWPGRSAG